MRVAWLWLVVLGKNTSDDIFVDFDAESERDDVCDSWTTVAGIALLQIDDGIDKFPRWTFGSGSSVTFVAEQAAIFTFHQGAVEFEQSRWFDDYSNRQ